MDWTVLLAVLVGAAMLVGLVGSALLVLPGLVVVWASTLVWALAVQSTAAWWVLGIATVLAGTATVVQYLVPGRRMKAAGIRTSTLLVGVLGGIVGFFVIPVVGLFVGFVGGVFLAQALRGSSGGLTPWQATLHALKAVGTSILIELLAGMLIAGTWLASLVLPALF
ncbi:MULTISPECIES: DUF456 domain-containing protein [Kytococcus]|uniref:DUF456 domain-containing protein n=1 Tax=Kytococcus schroeteri TaxID=138300 RepID=A0A2I1PAR3_9MICO|nr:MULTISPECIES: DUF456 domain-containing protein [Kytococcus]OFS16050.1 hypothetical protein HMPREF3099_00440 [Kytococcus sp. HMSC28H12]PKZ41693.1 DUF456 domain-containing protein [Kytococcus schroeteri]